MVFLQLRHKNLRL